MWKRPKTVSSTTHLLLSTLLPLLLAACVDSGVQVPPALSGGEASQRTASGPLPLQSGARESSNFEYQEDIQPAEDPSQEGWIDYRDFDFGSRAPETETSEGETNVGEIPEPTSHTESSPSTPSPSSHTFSSYAHLAELVLVVDKATMADSKTGQSLTVFKNGS